MKTTNPAGERRAGAAPWRRWFAFLLASFAGVFFAAGVTTPTAYRYDSNNQLAKVTYADGRQVSYGYDDMGNLVSVSVANASTPLVLVTEPILGKINMPIDDYTITVNVPADVTAYIASGLPAGLELNGGTTVNADGKAPGVIYGTPTVSGVFRVALAAKSALGAGSPTTLIVNIANPFTRMEDDYDVAGKGFARIGISAVSGGELGGSLAITVSKTGAFTGKLTLGAKSYAVKGQFESQYGGASIVIDRPAPLTDLTLNLGIGLEGSLRGMLFGDLREGANFSNIDGNVSVWGAAKRATVFSGAKGSISNIAFVIDPALIGNTAYPQGSGFAAMRITPAGDVALAGKLADGTAIAGKSMIFWDGDVPLYLGLYRGKGSLSGTIHVSDGGTIDVLGDNTVSGTLKWHRLAIAGGLYPAGFPAAMTLNVFGGYYTAPPSGYRVLDLGNGATHTPVALMLSEGGLPADLISGITISTGNVVTLFTPNNNSLSLRFTAKNGLFSGKFTVPTPTRTTSFQGIVTPAHDATSSLGYGYFLLPGATPADSTLSGDAFINQ